MLDWRNRRSMDWEMYNWDEEDRWVQKADNWLIWVIYGVIFWLFEKLQCFCVVFMLSSDQGTLPKSRHDTVSSNPRGEKSHRERQRLLGEEVGQRSRAQDNSTWGGVSRRCTEWYKWMIKWMLNDQFFYKKNCFSIIWKYILLNFLILRIRNAPSTRQLRHGLRLMIFQFTEKENIGFSKF